MRMQIRPWIAGLVLLSVVSASVQAAPTAYKPGEVGYSPFGSRNFAPTGTQSGDGAPATRMTDGDMAGTGFPGGTTNFVWYERFASPATINQLRLYQPYDRSWASWELAYDNVPGAGETFVTWYSGGSSDWGKLTEGKYLSLTTDALRYTVVSGGTIDTRGREIELYNTAGGLPTDIINNRVISSVQSSAAKGSAAAVVDGSMANEFNGWQPGSNGSVTPEWAYWLFAQPTQVQSVRLMMLMNGMPDTVKIQSLKLGGNPTLDADWVDWATRSGLNNYSGTLWFNDGFNGGFVSSGVRLWMNGANASGWFNIGEVEIFVPEPATGAFLALAGAGLLLRRRRV